MTGFTSFVLFLVMAGLAFYVLYLVVRRAVADGIRDARRDADKNVAATSASAPETTPGA